MRKWAAAGAVCALLWCVGVLAAPATRPSAPPTRGKPAAPSSKPSTRAAAADRPATGPAAAATQPAANPGSRVILAEVIEYLPPDGWEEHKASKKPNRDAYVSHRDDGMIAIELLPTQADVYPGMSAAIIKQLREWRKAKGQKVVMEPKSEPDKRFVLRIHEKYRVDDHGEKTADQLHLYRQVGPRLVMMTINAVSEDADRLTAIQTAGEEAILSATFVRPAKPPAGGKKGK